ncbi:MAG: hypothetical protein EBT07_08720 [Actinobacteria bacterium]|nr:hypothetical protein [Actinomycetota bacterium]
MGDLADLFFPRGEGAGSVVLFGLTVGVDQLADQFVLRGNGGSDHGVIDLGASICGMWKDGAACPFRAILGGLWDNFEVKGVKTEEGQGGENQPSNRKLN